MSALPTDVRSRRGDRRNPLSFYLNLSRLGGEVVPYRSFGRTSWLLNHPRWVEHVLLEHADRYTSRPHPYAMLEPYLARSGRLLLGLDREQAKHEGHALRTLVSAWADRLVQRLTEAATDCPAVDVTLALDGLNLEMMSELLFGVALSRPRAEQLVIATNWVEETLVSQQARFSPQLDALDPLLRSRYVEARRIQTTVAAEVLQTARQGPPLLTPESSEEAALLDAVTRTLLNSALATTIAWTLHLLAQHPATQDQLRGALDGPEPRRAPTLARQVLSESLRLFPPVWLFHRQAIQADRLAGHSVEAGDLIGICMHALHRLPGQWDEPDAFRPERFGPTNGNARSRCLYMPFGVGPRRCAAGHMAMPLLQIILTRVLASLRFEAVPEHPTQAVGMVALQPHPGITLRLEAVGRR